MPCNAFGHSSTCDCGWGGVNHDPWRPNINTDWSHASSHTTPNARCPMCQNKVFFYRSPNGGAVFFDELGPPWPKHPCTDKSFNFSLPGRINDLLKTLPIKNTQAKNKKRKHRKIAPQWWPYPCGMAKTLPNNEGICLQGEDGKRLFIKKQVNNITASAPIWIRATPKIKGKYDVSTFRLKNGIPIMQNYVGYSLQGILNSISSEDFKVTLKEALGISEIVVSSAKNGA